MSIFGRVVRRFLKNQQYADEVAFFRDVSIFHGLSTRQLGRLMQAMQRRRYTSGEVLFSEGQVGKAVFIIRSGQIELMRATNGKPRSLGKLGPGQIFGEMALLEQLPRTASATVVEDGEIFLLYTSTLEALIQRQPNIGVKLLRNMSIMLSSLLRKTNQQYDRKETVA